MNWYFSSMSLILYVYYDIFLIQWHSFVDFTKITEFLSDFFHTLYNLLYLSHWQYFLFFRYFLFLFQFFLLISFIRLPCVYPPPSTPLSLLPSQIEKCLALRGETHAQGRCQGERRMRVFVVGEPRWLPPWPYDAPTPSFSVVSIN